MADEKASTDAQYGLVLDLPGAPNTPHLVSGLEGAFVADQPRPLDEVAIAGEFYEIDDEETGPRIGFRADGPPRPLSLEEAKKLNELEGVPVALMQQTAKNGWKRVAGKKAAAASANDEKEKPSDG
jgi:hypothetical protein